MSDAASTTYGVGFSVDISSLDKVEQRLDRIEQATDGVGESGAQMGARIGQAGSLVGSALEDARGGAVKMGSSIDRAGTQAGKALDDAGRSGEQMGESIRDAMINARKEGKHFGPALQTGIGAALNKIRIQSKATFSDMQKGVQKTAKEMGAGFSHPLRAIKQKFTQTFDSAIDRILGFGKNAKKAGKKTEDLGKQGKEAGDELKEMGAKGESAGAKLTNMFKGAFGAALAIEAIKKATGVIKKFVGSAISTAMETEKIGAKFDAVFKDGSVAVGEWAEKYGSAANRAKDKVKGFLVSSQTMYTQLGMSTNAATKMSEATTALAYDLGTAFKMDDAEALSSLQSAIQGDTKALADMGIQLDDTVLKQQAQAMGIHKSIDDLDDSTAAQVRFGAILQQTEKYQGKALNSMGGLTGGVKSLKSIFQNFMSDAGAKFTPVIERLLRSVLGIWPQLEPAMMQFVDLLAYGLGQAAPLLMGFATDIIPMLVGNVGNLLSIIMPVGEILLDVVKTILPPLTEQFKILGSTLTPILVNVLGKLYDSAIKPLLPMFIQLVENVLPPLVAIIGTLAGTVLPPLIDIFGIVIQSILPPLMDLFDEITTNVLPPLVDAFQFVISQAIQPLMPLIDKFANTILPPLVNIFKNIISTLLPPLIELFKTIISSVMPPLMKVFNAYFDAMTPVLSALDKLMSKLLPVVSDLFSGLGPILGTVLNALSPVADMLGVVVGWVGKLIEYVSNGAGKVVDFFKNLTGGAKTASDAGATIPHNATGTNDFQGGPTFMNEAGGELAVLPKGSVIIPADKSERIVNTITEERGDTLGTQSTRGSTIVNNVIDIKPFLQKVERPLAEQKERTDAGKEGHAECNAIETVKRPPPKYDLHFNITINGNVSGEQKRETEEWFRRIVRDTMDEYNDEQCDERIVQDASNL